MGEKRRTDPSISVSNQQRTVEVSAAKVRQTARRVLREEGAEGELSIAIVDDAKIRELNQAYLGKDRETDVLSFALNDEHESLSGEVIVSADTAAREAAARDRSADDELALYLVHGILHLLGYDDTTAKKRSLMWERQRELLALLGYEPPK